MPTNAPLRYPVDLTGTSVNNLIVGEAVALVHKSFRCIAPIYAPFFKKNVEITDVATGLPISTSQYKCLGLVPLPSAMAGIGNELYSIIVITDLTVSDNVRLNYHTVGGEYTTSFETTKQMIDNLLSDARPLSWPSVVNRPEFFNPSLHLHAIGDVIGFEYLVVELEKLRQVILLGDETSRTELLTYIDNQKAAILSLITGVGDSSSALAVHIANQANPHHIVKSDIDLGNVQNFAVATNQEAIDGVAEDKYMTPALVSVAITGRGDSGLSSGHINNLNNPHQDTKTTIGLPLVQNYAVASAYEISNPTAGSPRYVTNINLKSYFDTFFLTFGNDLTVEVTYVKAQADTALINANSSNSAASTALANANTAATNSAAAVVTANQAKALAITDNDGVAASVTAGAALVSAYATQAAADVVAADAAGYTRGSTAGYSSGYTVGNTAGIATGDTAGYTRGSTAGYNTGYTAGNTAGYNTGYTAGNTAGYTAGNSAGVASGDAAGYARGYLEGYIAGVAYGQANPAGGTSLG